MMTSEKTVEDLDNEFYKTRAQVELAKRNQVKVQATLTETKVKLARGDALQRQSTSKVSTAKSRDAEARRKVGEADRRKEEARRKGISGARWESEAQRWRSEGQRSAQEAQR